MRDEPSEDAHLYISGWGRPRWLGCSLLAGLGFSMQPSQRLRPIRPTHSWLHDKHKRISSVAPALAFAAKSASAICPRTTPTRSQ